MRNIVALNDQAISGKLCSISSSSYFALLGAAPILLFNRFYVHAMDSRPTRLNMENKKKLQGGGGVGTRNMIERYDKLFHNRSMYVLLRSVRDYIVPFDQWSHPVYA